VSAPWVRLYVLVEGQTEKAFADATLKPHLVKFCIELVPWIVVTSRKLGARGGVLNVAQVKNDLARLTSQHRNATDRFTTMLDLHALPREFPSWQAAQSKPPIEKVKVLEDALAAEVNDRRFVPYLQLHEFEALLFCDLAQLTQRIAESDKGIAKLQAEVRGIAPEDINDGATTAPSKRILRHLPTYERQKVRVGAPAAAAIGLQRLRSQCPHFDGWVAQLEAMGTPL
jgi:hypothetical protein